MKILHVTTVHSPLDPRIFHKECRTLAGAGFDVTLAAHGVPGQPIDDVHFLRLGSRGGNRFCRIAFGKLRLVQQLLAFDADIYHIHDPELLPLLPVLRLRGKHVVYDAHEHLHDSLLSKPYLPAAFRGVIARSARGVERVVGRKCSLVVAATPDIGAQFDSHRTSIIHNYPALDHFDGMAPRTLDEFAGRAPHGVYVGGLTALRYAEQMFRAADAVALRHPGAKLTVAGPTYQVDDPARHPGVHYLGPVPASDVPALLGQARLGVVLLADTPAYAASLPTKFFEYLAAGLPVVASRSARALVDVITEHGCGLLVDGHDVEDVARAMIWLLEHPDEAFTMGQRGATVARTHYSWTSEGTKLVTAYRQLASPEARSSRRQRAHSPAP